LRMLSGNSRRSYSDWGVKPSLALRGHREGLPKRCGRKT